VSYLSFFSNFELIYITNFCLLASELTAAAIILQFWTPRLLPWQWAIIIIVPIFGLQLIHVRAYGANPFVLPFAARNLTINHC
jgi:amino acid permease